MCFAAGSSRPHFSAAPPPDRLMSSQSISVSSSGSNRCPVRDRDMRSYLRFSGFAAEAMSDMKSLLYALLDSIPNKLEPAFQTRSKFLQVPGNVASGLCDSEQ